MFRVLITGSRDLDSEEDKNLVYKTLMTLAVDHQWDISVIHGKCPTGIDKWAAQFAEEYKEFGVQVEEFKAKWKLYGKAAGQLRNQEMVDTEPDLVVAFPFGASPGTRGCIKKAHEANLVVVQILP
jgi:hypothetical protein